MAWLRSDDPPRRGARPRDGRGIGVARNAWLVLIPGLELPVLGGPRAAAAGATTYTTTLAVFVDPRSSEFLEAASLAN